MGRIAGLAPEQTRQRVVDGAAAVFADQGFERARIADIAEAAGLSSGAIYNHFDSKADLLAAVITCHTPHELDAALAAGDATGLLDVVEARGRQLGRRGPMLSPLLLEAITAARRDPDVRRVLTDTVSAREEVFSAVIELAQSSGDVAADADPRAVARFLLTFLLGSMLVRAVDLPDLDPVSWDSLITRLVDSFRSQEDR